MKKSIGIFVLLLSTVVLLSSCKKNVANLPGTWYAISATIDNDHEDDLDDVWTFKTDGTCNIECDMDEYFDNTYDHLFFHGNYVVNGNMLTITSDKLNEYGDYYETVVYELSILKLDKNTLRVSGTVIFNRYEGNEVYPRRVPVSISLSKR